MKKASDITTWDRMKHAVARYLLSSEVDKVNMERETYKLIQDSVKRKLEDVEAYEKSIDIVAVFRKQIEGFDPHLLDTDEDLPAVLGDIENQDAFLSKMKSLSDQVELRQLIDFLKREQIIHIAKYADTLDKQNFGRATLNGFELLMSEIDRLATVYVDRHKQDDDFDKNEVV